MNLKVDDLLENYVRTPKFTCAVMKPTAGSLRYLDDGNGGYVYAKGNAPYMQQDQLDINQYIKATGCAQFEALETEDIKILQAFLRLAEEAQLKDGKRHIDPRSVFNLCYRYGFPKVQMDEVPEKGLLMGFTVNDFFKRLDNLYICYALWKALQVHEYDLIQQVWPYPLTEIQMQLELEHRLFADIVVTVLYIDTKPVLTYQAKNLMALVEAQLAVLISKGDDYLDGGYIDHCADCGQPFIKYRSNSTLCEKCKGNTGKSRRRRARRKAEMKGDQKNG